MRLDMKINKNDISNWSKLWQNESKEAQLAANGLFKDKQYHFSLFFCHLALEKAIKAYYLLVKQEFPPPVHDLLYLLSKAGSHTSQEDLLQYSEINTYNIRARYDDYKRSFYRKATSKYCREWLEKTQKLLKHVEDLI